MAVTVAMRPADWVPPERPSLYYKTVLVEVVSVNQRTWFAGARHYIVELDVKSNEYGLTKHIEERGSGFFGQPECWNVKKGDLIDATLHSWVMESTGEVVKREIAGLA